MSYYEPKTQKGLFGNILLWVVALCLVGAVIAVAGWRLNWWLTGKAVNYQAHIIRNGYANQQTLRDQITAKLGDVATITVQLSSVDAASEEYAALRAQRLAVAAIVCQDVEEVTGDPLPVDQQQWSAANCLNGSVSPSSTLN